MKFTRFTGCARRSNKLHQYCNDLTYPYPICWNSTENQWKISEKKNHGILSYYRLPCAYRLLLNISLLVQCIYLATTRKPQPPHLLPFTLIEFLGFAICLSVDAMCHSFGDSLVLTANWSNKQGRLWLNHFIVFGTAFINVCSNNILIHFYLCVHLILFSGKIPYNTFMDMLDLCQIANITLLMIILAPVCSYFCEDPPYYLIQYFKPSNEFLYKMMLALRYIHNGYLGLVGTITLRTISLLGIQQLICRNVLLHVLPQKPFNKCTIALYREMEVVTKIVFPFESIGAEILFGAGFMFMLVAIGASFIGYQKDELSFALPALMLGLITMGFVQVALVCGTRMNLASGRLLRTWRDRIRKQNLFRKSTEGAVLIRLVKSLHSLEMPVGHICVVNKSVEMLYLNLFLNQLVNLMMCLGNQTK